MMKAVAIHHHLHLPLQKAKTGRKGSIESIDDTYIAEY
jgi:hypothetical protein